MGIRTIGEFSIIMMAIERIVTNNDCRSEEKFSGKNNIHFGEGLENYVTLPVVQPR
jgi:hypothetical protein